jgi:hypothetical protein
VRQNQFLGRAYLLSKKQNLSAKKRKEWYCAGNWSSFASSIPYLIRFGEEIFERINLFWGEREFFGNSGKGKLAAQWHFLVTGRGRFEYVFKWNELSLSVL